MSNYLTGKQNKAKMYKLIKKMYQLIESFFKFIKRFYLFQRN